MIYKIILNGFRKKKGNKCKKVEVHNNTPKQHQIIHNNDYQIDEVDSIKYLDY